jgi:AcrR family transcriptional regulator
MTQTSTAILDATLEAVLETGVRRTTLTDVARRAGVSRMTVYRHYPDVDAVLRDLMTRELGAILATVAARADGVDGRARLVAMLLDGIRELRTHPVLQRVLEAEPELLLPYLVGRIGDSQRGALHLLELAVVAGQADGTVRAGDPRTIASGLLLLSQSFLFSGGTVDGLAPADLDGELARLADAALAPAG